MKTIPICRPFASLAVAFALASFAGPALAKELEFSIGLENTAKLVEAKPHFSPEPEIPSSMQEESFQRACLARFHIDQTGKPEVKLLSTSGSDEVDEIVLETLKRWRFSPATLDGKPVESTRRIKVELEIE